MKMAHGTKRCMVDSDVRGADVDAGQRSCKSSDVRDP